MKICIPTENDRGLEAEMSGHFGSAPFFTIIDTDGDDPEVIRTFGRSERHHADHHVGELKAHDIEAVVCDGVGRRAFAALRRAGIDVLSPGVKTVAGIVEAVRKGNTTPLTEAQACGGRGHGSGRHRGGSHGCRERGHDHGRHLSRNARSRPLEETGSEGPGETAGRQEDRDPR